MDTPAWNSAKTKAFPSSMEDCSIAQKTPELRAIVSGSELMVRKLPWNKTTLSYPYGKKRKK